MIDFATLVMRTDSRGLLEGERAMDRLARRGEQTEQRVDRAMDGVSSAMRSVASAAGALLGTLSAAAATTFAFQAAEEYSRMANGLRAMGSSAAEAGDQLRQISEIALSTRAPLDATVQLYSRIRVAAGELGASNADILAFTENVGLALGAAGVGANEASGALFQLAQAMAGGTVRAEEFNSILEGAYPLALAAARGIEEAGGSVGKLRQLVVEGKISSEEFFRAIISQSQNLQEAFANTDMTVGQAMTNLTTALTMFIGEINQTLGITAALASAIDFVAQNLDRLAAYAAAAATVAAAYFAPAILAAAFAFGRLAAAALLTRAALIRTGIGALVVGLGELIYWIDSSIEKVGGFANAWTLLSDVAGEAWDRIGLYMDAAMARMMAGWEGLKSSTYSILDSIIVGVVSFGDRTIAVFQGAYDGAVAIWGSLPGAIGDFAYQAANGLIGGVEAMLNAVVTRINNFINSLNSALALLPDWATGGGVAIGTLGPVALGRVDNPFAGGAEAAGRAAAEAFNEAMAQTYVNAPDTGLAAAAQDAAARASAYSEAAGMLGQAASRPLSALQNLREALFGSGEAAAGAAAETDGVAESLARISEEATGGGSGGAARALEETSEAAQKLEQTAQRLEDSFADTMTSIVTGASSAREAVSNLLNSLAQMAINSAFKSLFSGLFDPIAWIFSANGNVFSGGRVQAFANGGVVSGPTVFPMAGRQMGLMGEAGPEAIMPLSRGRDGKLGVHSEPQTIRLVVEAEEGELFVPRVRQISGNVALQVSSRVSQAQKAAFGSTIDSYDQRGTT